MNLRPSEAEVRQWFIHNDRFDAQETGEAATYDLINYTNAHIQGPGFSTNFAKEERSNKPLFDGQTLNIWAEGVANNSLVLEITVIHEWSHFLVAPPSRRNTPNFGLGSAFDTAQTKSKLKYKNVDEEECLACHVNIMLVAAFGLSWSYIAEELYCVGKTNIAQPATTHRFREYCRATSDGSDLELNRPKPFVELRLWKDHPYLLQGIRAVRQRHLKVGYPS